MLVVACLGGLLLVATLVLGHGGFTPGEELVSPAAADIAASTQDTTYPRSDTRRFEGRPGVVYVYLRVEDLPARADLKARVERASRTSVLSRLFGGTGLSLVNEEEKPLGASGGGVSGVVKFAVRPADGGSLPAGDYTVEVYAGPDDVVAKKYFVVGD